MPTEGRYSNVQFTVDELRRSGDFERVKSILGHLAGDPLLLAVYEDDEQGCLAFHFSRDPALEGQDETIRWRMAELRNACAWLHARSDRQIRQLSDGGFRFRLNIWVDGPEPGFASTFFIPKEVVAEANRFQAQMGLYIRSPPSRL